MATTSTTPIPVQSSPLAATIPAEHVQHREAHWQFVLNEAEPRHRERLTRLLAVWEDANRRYYGGVLVPPIILLAEPSKPSLLGQCYAVSSHGARSEIRLRPSLLDGTHPHVRPGPDYAEGRVRFVADVLLHEQIHQWQQEVTDKIEKPYHGHGRSFCAKCNEIGGALGLALVLVRTRPGHQGEAICPHWPHNVRSRDYYLGAYVPSSGDKAVDLDQLARRLRRQLGEDHYRELARLMAADENGRGV